MFWEGFQHGVMSEVSRSLITVRSGQCSNVCHELRAAVGEYMTEAIELANHGLGQQRCVTREVRKRGLVVVTAVIKEDSG